MREAFKNNEGKLDSLCSSVDIAYPPDKIYIRIFKYERTLELWAQDDGDHKFKLLRKYSMTAFSGKLGPKRAEGDMQIPEGFYRVDRFNPASRYHLSLRIDYPNKSDIIRKKGDSPGGEIFIHGSNVTIGCVPVGNSQIENLYAIAVDVKSAGQPDIPVHIFPFKMNSEFADSVFSENGREDEGLLEFWKELTPVFNYFETHREIPAIGINGDGGYVIKDAE